MHTRRATTFLLTAFLGALLSAWQTPLAHGQVRSLTVGIDTTCPYGLIA